MKLSAMTLKLASYWLGMKKFPCTRHWTASTP